MRKSILAAAFTLFMSGYSLSETIVHDEMALNLLYGSHPIALQWISWDYFGEAEVSYDEDGFLALNGQQRGKGAYADDDYLWVNGRITEVGELYFKFSGDIFTQINHINDGDVCQRTGDFEFRITKNRKYWRLQEMTNPCDGVTDYVDLFFRINKYPLAVSSEPEGAKIRVLNIGPVYAEGMVLEEGKYHLEVSKEGFETTKIWVDLDEEHQNFGIVLDPIK